MTERKTKKPLPFTYQFIAGGIAGTSEILVMYPLDVVKTRFQLQTKSGGPSQYKSITDAFSQIIRDEGFGRLYRGILPPILMEAPKRAIKFAANEQFTGIFSKYLGLDSKDVSSDYKRKWKPWLPVCSGVAAGCTEAFIVVPFELVKIRLQDKTSAGKYKNTLDCFQKIIAEEGVGAFAKGIESTIWRHGIWSGAYFGLIGVVTDALKDADMDGKLGQTGSRFVAGLIGGSVATFFNTPFDVIKTRVQNNVYFAMPDNFESVSFSRWIMERPEVLNMLQGTRRKDISIFLFRPLEDLSLFKPSNTQESSRKNELEDIVIRNRNGVVLSAQLILKLDQWKRYNSSTGLINGAPNFRRVGDQKLFAAAQPTLDGIKNVVAFLQTFCKQVVWINLREEPLVYINGNPYVLRDGYHTLRNLKSYAGITEHRLDLLEYRLKEDVLKECSTYDGKVLLHEESENMVLPVWTSIDLEEVFTLRELFSSFSGVKYIRIPVTAEAYPEEKDFDLILGSVLEYFSEETSFILNCQFGEGRSTTGTVILCLIMRWLDFHRSSQSLSSKRSFVDLRKTLDDDYLENPSIGGNYQVIHSLMRVIRNGLGCKSIVDKTIDLCAASINLRDCIEDWRSKAENAGSEEERSVALARGLNSVTRYFYLIAFESFLQEVSPKSLSEMDSFCNYFKKHAEFVTMLRDMEKGSINSLIQVQKMQPGDGIALTSEVLDVVGKRKGSVLSQQMILKYDHFPGCQKSTLVERIEGAPNYREVQCGDFAVKIAGVAMPKKEAVPVVIKKIMSQDNQNLTWISLREEPVIYINGKPYVLRTFQDPFRNIETTGIDLERVESIEERMKQDIIKELQEYNGRLLLHDEEKAFSNFHVVPVWESVRKEDILTPSEVFLNLKHSGVNVDYYRVPITDEQAPIPHVFDILTGKLKDFMSDKNNVIFNCQMGRGRTTTGMVIAFVLQTIKSYRKKDFELSSPIEESSRWVLNTNSNEEERTRYTTGEYKIILQLLSVIQYGILSKRIVDEAIDKCDHIQNLRDAIYDFKLRTQSIVNPRKSTVFHVGINYLIRYFFLITFTNYLLERNASEWKSFKSFESWLSERREIINLADPDNVDFS